jgi:molybdate transport system substrate-binding protein
MNSWIKRVISSLLLLLMAGCAAQILPGQSVSSDTATSAPDLTVAAAADLQFAFADMEIAFEKETGKKVTMVYGSTGQLVQQVENGAPYDLLAAANISYIDQLTEEGLARKDSIEVYARGHLVLAVNRACGLKVEHLSDLLSPDVQYIAIANPEHAPYGLAAKQVLQSSGLWDALQPKLVLGENIRQTLQYLQAGDAQAGIIALSLADVPEISWSLIDDSLYQPLDQALATLTSSQQPELAAEFAHFINSETGRQIMRKYKFLLPDEMNTLQVSGETASP